MKKIKNKETNEFSSIKLQILFLNNSYTLLK